MSRVRAMQPHFPVPDSPIEINPKEDVKRQVLKLRENFNALWTKYQYLVSDNGYFSDEFFTSIIGRGLPMTFQYAKANQAVFTNAGAELESREITGAGKVVMSHNPYGHGIWTIPHIRNLNNDLILAFIFLPTHKAF